MKKQAIERAEEEEQERILRERKQDYTGPFLKQSSLDDDPASDVERYQLEYARFKTRSNIVRNGMKDTEEELREMEKREQEGNDEIERLKYQESTISAKIEKLMNQLELVTDQIQQATERRDQTQNHRRELQKKLLLSESTLESLQVQMDKSRIIISELSPNTKL